MFISTIKMSSNRQVKGIHKNVNMINGAVRRMSAHITYHYCYFFFWLYLQQTDIIKLFRVSFSQTTFTVANTFIRYIYVFDDLRVTQTITRYFFLIRVHLFFCNKIFTFTLRMMAYRDIRTRIIIITIFFSKKSFIDI